jgi:hypothetical protein
MKKKQPQKTIDDYISNNELNACIYEVLLKFQDSETLCRGHPKKTPLEIFNQVYEICERLTTEKHPENLVDEIWDKLHSDFLMCEISIIFSCVYVAVLFLESKNSNTRFFLTSIKRKIDIRYFEKFEPLIREEFVRITATKGCFELLKTEADKIADLNSRELFYIDVFMHFKQSKNKENNADFLQKVSNEIDFIERIKPLIPLAEKQEHKAVEKSETDEAELCTKVRAFALLELLREFGVSTAEHDLSKICRLIAGITGGSYHNIYINLQKGINFKKNHYKQIDKINNSFAELNISVSIEKK